MSDHSVIEWTDSTWNPTVGCDKVSAGCQRCYAITQAYRLEHGFKQPAYSGLTRKLPDGSVNWTGLVRELPERLAIPLGWKKPARIFVDSMSDLFHEDVSDEFIDQVFAIMAWAEWHTFQVLTKRPERMLRYMISAHSGCERKDHITAAMCGACVKADGQLCGWGNDDCQMEAFNWPLPNVWLGTSVEDQRAADERIPLLLQTPAAVRLLSAEPLLGPIQLGVGGEFFDYGLGRDGRNEPRIHWVIVGGESGPHSRPCDPEWVRSLRDQCQAAHVAYFFKQWGGRIHAAGGRLLDGRTWDEFPELARVVAHASR